MRNALFVAVYSCLIACGGGSTAPAASKSITLTGALTPGSSTLAAARWLTVAGAKLYCVTFEANPTSASGTADSTGKVSLTIDAKSTPLGCFITDATGKGVASVFFQSGSQSGQMVSLTADANLGTILVDDTTGIAQVTLPSGGTIVTTTPATAACPLGTWDVTIGPAPVPPCPTGSVDHVRIWIAQASSGIVTSLTDGPKNINNSNRCSSFSQSDLPTTYDTATRTTTFSFPENTGCSGSNFVVTAVADSACHSAAISTKVTGCGSCTGTGDCMSGCPQGTVCSDGCCGCGSLTCAVGSFTATKQ